MPNTKLTTVCYVFTKQFPFGIQESYLLDEAPFLAEYFDRVVYVPYAEFRFEKKELRIELTEKIRVLNVNTQLPRLGVFARIRTLWPIIYILFFDLFTSRERLKTFSRLYQNALRLFHYSVSAIVLKRSVKAAKEEKLVFYHYWLHDGMIIQKLAQGVLQLNWGYTIARSHSLDLYHKDWPLRSYLAYERVKVNMCDMVSSISYHGWKHLCKTFPALKEKFVHRPLGVHHLGLTAVKFGHPEPLIVTVSWITQLKRLDRVLALMKALPRTFRWVHIGSGAENILSEIQSETERVGINFEAKGYLSKPEVYKFFQEHSVAFFCNMSVWEGVPVSLMDAAMLGIPMIVSDIPGNKEVVDGKNGWVVSGDDWSEEMVREIVNAYEQPNIWRAMSESARATFDLKYNAVKNYTSFYDFVKEESSKWRSRHL
jgi:colanic acid/amylovoran biosynthesis glycosyltransferase